MRRLGRVRALTGFLFVALVATAGCGGDGRVPTPAISSPTTPNTPTPTNLQPPAMTPAPSLLPLPGDISRIPGREDPSAELSAQTPSGEIAIGEERDFVLGHCGLLSPIDIDGSLWDAIGGHNGAGGPLTEDQLGDLINATPTMVTLIDEETMEMRTTHGAVVTLTRHEGPRRYFLCA